MTTRPATGSSWDGYAAATDDEHTSLVVYMLPIVRHARLVIGAGLIVATAAVVVASLRPVMYSQSVSFTSDAPGNQTQSLSGLASQFGLNIGGGADKSSSPEFYAAVLESRDISAVVINQPYTVASGQTVPTLSALWEIEAPSDEERLRRTIKALGDYADVATDPVTGIVRLEARAETPGIARQIVKAYITAVQEFNTRRRRQSATADYEFARTAVDEARQQLTVAEQELTSFRSRNRIVQGPSVILEAERLERATNIREQVYVALVRTSEETRLASLNRAPQLVVVDSPEGPTLPVGRGRLKAAVFGFVLGAVLGILVVYAREFRRWLTLRASTDTNLAELLDRLALRPKGQRGRGAPTSP